jgi:hypothetical protein
VARQRIGAAPETPAVKVDSTFADSAYHYRITLDEDDRVEAARGFRGVVEDPIRLVGDRYQVELPVQARDPHPDLHATAIAYVLGPFIGTRLELSFGVSQSFAETFQQHAGMAVCNVDPNLSPRPLPPHPRPALLFSGGTDSAAASLLLPPETVVLFLDRIPRGPERPGPPRSLVDMTEARAMCRQLQRHGQDVVMLHEDHEALIAPYPTWHSEMSRLLPLYLADTFSICTFETGDVLDVFGLGGYHDGSATEWVFRPQRGVVGDLDALQPGADDSTERRPASAAADARSGNPWAFHQLRRFGLVKVSSIGGLCEVATAKIVNRSDYRRRAASCYFHADSRWLDSSFCLSCDKCFRKLLLSFIDDGAECPAEIFDNFLRQRHLKQALRKTYLDWHHVYYYIFQRLKCRHPLALELQRQAEQGPDLSLLERWYSPASVNIPSAYREATLRKIRTAIGEMSDAEVAQMDGLTVPPLSIPERWLRQES